jgi:hypothetical protein
MWFLFIDKNNTYTFWETLTMNNNSVLISETEIGISLLSNYFNNSIYSNYYFSYIINTFYQLLRTLTGNKYPSLGEHSSEYFTNSQMGTAFSAILESLLNFGYLGPFILPVILFFIIKKFLKNNNRFYYLFSAIAVFLVIKLVRTELAVILKLYVIPILLFIFIINKYTNKDFFKKLKLNAKNKGFKNTK